MLENPLPPSNVPHLLWALVYLGHWSVQRIHRETGIGRSRLERVLRGYGLTHDEADSLRGCLLSLRRSIIDASPKLQEIEPEELREFHRARYALINVIADQQVAEIDVDEWLKTRYEWHSCGELRKASRLLGIPRETLTEAINRGGYQRYEDHGIRRLRRSRAWLEEQAKLSSKKLQKQQDEEEEDDE